MAKTPKVVEFAKFTPEEKAAVDRIVARALQLYEAVGRRRDPMDIEMDLAAVHFHTPLRLEELATADDFNFTHDVGGIDRHIDRRTGELTDHFRPRAARTAVQ